MNIKNNEFANTQKNIFCHEVAKELRAFFWFVESLPTFATLVGRKESKLSWAIPFFPSSHLYLDLLSSKRNPFKVFCNRTVLAKMSKIWNFISYKHPTITDNVLHAMLLMYSERNQNLALYCQFLTTVHAFRHKLWSSSVWGWLLAK